MPDTATQDIFSANIPPLLGIPSPELEDYQSVRHFLSREALLKMVQKDPGLPEHSKHSVMTMIMSHPIESLLAGSVGAALAHSLAKHEKLSREAQFLAGMGGFGAGTVIMNTLIGEPVTRQGDNPNLYSIPLR